MTEQSASYRQILRSSSIIGGASVINIALGIVRMKAAAVLLGPAGVGLIGLLTNLAGVASSVAGLGVGNVGTRQIAEASGNNDQVAVSTARRALFFATLVLAVLGASIVWVLRGVLAEHILHDASLSDEVGWLALAVGLSIASASQNALLRGLRRIGDMSRVSIYSGVGASVIGVASLAIWGQSALLVYILITPVMSFMLGHWYVSRLPAVHSTRSNLDELSVQWRMLLRLGFAFMLAGLVASVGQLLVRSLIKNGLGLDAAGHFQAAWAISMTYIGFVLSAMGADYYPRLTAVIRDHAAVNRMVNEQTEVALLLAGPVFLAMMALAPWVIRLLYSAEFAPAVDVLHWQILGDILKVASWPIGYVLLAAGEGKTFVFTESVAMSCFALLTWTMLPIFGLESAGIAFLGMYFVLLPLVFWLARKRTGFSWDAHVAWHLAWLLTSGVVIFAICHISLIWATVLGLLISAGFGLYGFSRLAHKTELSGGLGKLAAKAQGVMKRAGVWYE